jgi:hypothetical protein
VQSTCYGHVNMRIGHAYIEIHSCSIRTLLVQPTLLEELNMWVDCRGPLTAVDNNRGIVWMFTQCSLQCGVKS